MEKLDGTSSGGMASGGGDHRTRFLAEWRRLARELHDGPVQVLATAALQLEVCQRLAEQGDMEALDQGLTRLAGTLRHGIADFRRIAFDLRQSVSGGRQLADALRDHVADYRIRTGLDTELELPNEIYLNGLSDRQQVTVLHVVQEATQNVYKHASASRVRIAFCLRPAGLEVCVEDDGCGFDVEQVPNPDSQHLGLIGMEEWAAEAGGMLRVESLPGQGSRVVLTVPLHNLLGDTFVGLR